MTPKVAAIVLGSTQFVAILASAILLGSDFRQTVGIALALWALMPATHYTSSEARRDLR